MREQKCIGIVSEICTVCGKQFVPTYYHMYKIKSKYQCSWTCYRKAGGGKVGRKEYATKKPKITD